MADLFRKKWCNSWNVYYHVTNTAQTKASVSSHLLSSANGRKSRRVVRCSFECSNDITPLDLCTGDVVPFKCKQECHPTLPETAIMATESAAALDAPPERTNPNQSVETTETSRLAGFADHFSPSQSTLKCADEKLLYGDQDEGLAEDNLNDPQDLTDGSSTYSYSYTKVWTIAATKLFISMYKELKNSSINGFNPTQRIIWHTISNHLKQYGFCYSPLQVENRFKSLKRSYLKKANGKRGRYTERWGHPFSHEMIELFGHIPTDDTTNHDANSSNEYSEATGIHSFGQVGAQTLPSGSATWNESEFISAETATPDAQLKIKEEQANIVEVNVAEGHCTTLPHSRSSSPFSSDSGKGALEGCSYTPKQPSLPRWRFKSRPQAAAAPAAAPPPPPLPPPVMPSLSVPEFFHLLREDLKEHRRIREKNKNRRHKEKMELLKQILVALEKNS